MKPPTVLLCAISLQACTGLQGVNTLAADEIAGAAHTIHTAAKLTLCRGITVGEWMREYGASPQLATAWRNLCAAAQTETPAAPATHP